MSEEKKPETDVRFYTFAQRQEMESKKEVPDMPKAEKIIADVLACLGIVSILAGAITALVFSLKSTNVNFPSDNGGYGVLGILSLILDALGLMMAVAINWKYDTRDVLKEDHLSARKCRNCVDYVAVLTLFTGFGFVWLRPNVTGRVTWAYLGILMMVLAIVLAIVGIVFNALWLGKKPTLVRYYNDAFYLLILWLPVMNYPLLANEVLGIANPACLLAVLAPIMMLLSFIAVALAKKRKGLHTIAHILSFGALSMEAVAIFYYAFFIAAQVNPL